ncbi:MAG: NADPH:quinone reductase-like Zn-dependent oxidoreductase [Flammeovirgaceae bacterium]|jgi:NADPH:quinone reductase-like Zn-dependent oxidoreductase
MKAFEYESYGAPEVLKMTEVLIPKPVKDEVLVKMKASTVTSTEATFRRGDPYFTRLFTGLRRPKLKRLGEMVAGVVEAVGPNHTEFKKGDAVFGTAGPDFGANAEYAIVSGKGALIHKPSSISFNEAAAAVDGFLTALPFLRDVGKIKKGQSILINGASGSVGSAAVQLAKHFGATVTAVCSGRNRALVKSLGADYVIDYTTNDFTKTEETYDIIFDAVGKLTFAKSKSSLKKKGVFLEVGIGLRVLGSVLRTSIGGGKKAKIAATGLRDPKEKKKELLLLEELMQEERFIALIDRTYLFDHIASAHEYVDTGRKRGNVLLKFKE